MEKKTTAIESQERHGSSQLKLQGLRNYPCESTSQNDAEHVTKKKRDKTTSSLWRNMSCVFSPRTSSCANVRVIKDKESTIRRLSSFFKLKKTPVNTIRPITNIGVSPRGYQVAVSETNIQPNINKTLAIAVRLPKGTTSGSVCVTIELDITGRSDDALVDKSRSNDDLMLLKCTEETESKTIFTGILKLPPNTDLATIVGMPLFLIDSKEKILLSAGVKLTYETVVKSSEALLVPQQGNCRTIEMVRITVNLENTIKGRPIQPKLEKTDASPKETISDVEECDISDQKQKELKCDLSKNSIITRVGALDIHYDSILRLNELLKTSPITMRAGILDIDYNSVSLITEVSETGPSTIENIYYDSTDRVKEINDTKATTDITKMIAELKDSELPEKKEENVDNEDVNLDSISSTKEYTTEETEDTKNTEHEANAEKTFYDATDYLDYEYSAGNTDVTIYDLADCSDNEDTIYDNLDYGNESEDGKTTAENSVNYMNEINKEAAELSEIAKNICNTSVIIHKLSATKPSNDYIKNITWGPTNSINELSVEHITSENIRNIIYDSLDYADIKSPLAVHNTNNMLNTINIVNSLNKSEVSETDVSDNKYDSTDQVTILNNKNAKCAAHEICDSQECLNKLCKERNMKGGVREIIYGDVEEDVNAVSDKKAATNIRDSVGGTESCTTKPTLKISVKDVTRTELILSINNETTEETSEVKADESEADIKEIIYSSNCGEEENKCVDNKPDKTKIGNEESSPGQKALELYEQRIEDETAQLSRVNYKNTLADEQLGYLAPYYPQKTLYNAGTQYSRTSTKDDKEINAQSSLFRKNWNALNESYNKAGPSTRPDNDTCSTVTDNQYSVLYIPIRSGSTLSTNTVSPKSTTSATTQYSSSSFNFTLNHSDSNNTHELKVPFNSPSSDTDVQLKSTRNALDFSLNSKEVDKIILTYKKPEKDWNPLITLTSQKSLHFSEFSSPEDELISTDLENIITSLHVQCEPKPKPDKTLELLEDARFKLASISHHNNYPKTNENDELIKVTDALPKDTNRKGLEEDQRKEPTNANVHCKINSFDSNPKEQEIHRRCYEDNDEYYERQRKDIRRYFEGEDRYADLIFNTNEQFQQERKKNLSGDNPDKIIDDPDMAFHTNLESDSYLLGNLPKTFEEDVMKNLICDPTEPDPLMCTCKSSSEICTCTLTSINKKLNTELNELQLLYEEMCSKLDSEINNAKLLKSCNTKILNVINNKCNEIEECNSKNNFCNPDDTKEKVKTTDKELIQERQQTYLNVENDIKRVIQELLKESEDIKEAAILQGAKEEADPPFSCELINALDAPFPVAMCTTILNNIINSSIDLSEQKKEENKDPTEIIHDDVMYILNVLLEETFKKQGILNDLELINAQTSRNKEVLEAINLLVEPREDCNAIHIGDVKCANKKSDYITDCENNPNNQQIVYFCNATTFNSKIPKTSYSFGEVPNKSCELSTKPRDGLTIAHLEHPRNVKTSRLFNELFIFNLQPTSSNENIGDNKANEENVSPHNDHYFAHVCKSDSQQFAEVTQAPSKEKETIVPTLEIVINGDGNDTPNQNENNNNGNSECGNNNNPDNNSPNSPKYTSEDEEEKVDQGTSNQECLFTSNPIPKSKKYFSLNSAIARNQQPSTSNKFYKETRTTDEEDIMHDIDLGEETLLSSTEPEYTLPPKLSQDTHRLSKCPMPKRPRLTSTSSSEEERMHPGIKRFIRKDNTKKHNEVIVIKPKRSIVSDSDTVIMDLSLCDGQQHSVCQSSHIALKPTEDVPDMQNNFKHNTEEANDSTISDSEYEGDHETVQMKFPNPRQKYKSKQDLNTPQEIGEIEKNVQANDLLTRKALTILSALTTSDISFEYTDSSSASNSELDHNGHLNSDESTEIKSINMENS